MRDGFGEPVHFRGINSSGNIVSWSLAFRDGTSTGVRSWAADPPVDVVHEYPCDANFEVVGEFIYPELTVTDAGGQSTSDSIALPMVDRHPD